MFGMWNGRILVENVMEDFMYQMKWKISMDIEYGKFLFNSIPQHALLTKG